MMAHVSRSAVVFFFGHLASTGQSLTTLSHQVAFLEEVRVTEDTQHEAT